MNRFKSISKSLVIFGLIVLNHTQLFSMVPPNINREYREQLNAALLGAARCGNIRWANRLIGQGANVNAADNIGNTAIHIASRSGYLELVKLLINRDANINTANNNGERAIDIAAANDRIELVDSLIERDADVEAEDNEHHKAIDVTVNNEIRMMLEHAQAEVAKRRRPRVKSAAKRAKSS